MTSDDFIAWREAMNVSQRDAARLLGCSRATVQAYEAGGTPPLYIALACAALVAGIEPYESKSNRKGKSK